MLFYILYFDSIGYCTSELNQLYLCMTRPPLDSSKCFYCFTYHVSTFRRIVFYRQINFENNGNPPPPPRFLFLYLSILDEQLPMRALQNHESIPTLLIFVTMALIALIVLFYLFIINFTNST